MILTTLILLVATLFGGWAFVLMGQRGIDNLSLILSFGGSFIIGMCFLHLVPESFSASAYAGVFVLAGFLIQGLLEFVSQGIEHGHFHKHDHGTHCEGQFQWKRLPLAALASLALHAALESMPVLEHSHHDHAGHVHGPLSIDMIDWGLVTGLVLHKVPVAMVLMAMMIEQHVPKRTAWLVLAAFGLSPLVGMLAFEGMFHALPSELAVVFPSWMQALVVGILLHIGTTVLFEAGDGHAFHWRKFAATCLGIATSLVAFL
jgi:zinc and cadmium transporter